MDTLPVPVSVKPRLAIELFGWYGALALLAAYGLHSLKVLEPGYVYQLLNLTGAAGVGLAAWSKRSYQPAVLEVIWGGIALFAMIRLAFWGVG